MIEKKEAAQAELTPVPQNEGALVEIAEQGVYQSLFSASEPTAVLEQARSLVQYIEALIHDRRRDYVATIDGNDYAMHTWWSANDVALGISHNTLPVQAFESSHITVEAYVNRCELFYGSGRLLGSAEAMVCADEPKRGGWKHHELFSKVQTRAFVKAHRLSLALLPILAGLQPISAEEIADAPLQFPGDKIDLEGLPDDIMIGLKALSDKDRWGDRRWGTTKTRAQLAKFLQPDGSIDEAKALTHLSLELDKLNAER